MGLPEADTSYSTRVELASASRSRRRLPVRAKAADETELAEVAPGAEAFGLGCCPGGGAWFTGRKARAETSAILSETGEQWART